VLSRTTYFFTGTSLADMIRSRRIVAAGVNHPILSNSLTRATSLTFVEVGDVEVGDVVPTLEPPPLCKRIVALGDHLVDSLPSFRASASNNGTGQI
jgi:hypothetical protein